MNRAKNILLTAVSVLAWTVLLNAQTPPELPYNPWGRITIDNQIVVNGTTVEAYINSTLVTTMIGGTNNSYYALTIGPDDPNTSLTDGGTNGDTIVIRVNGSAADTTLQMSPRQLARL